MYLLILGGTGFLGRHLVEAALGDGHRVTLFNRGLSGPDLFPEVETIQGDRDGDLSVLQGRRWDAAIDTCGYVPRLVRASAGLLADAVDHYAFVSNISVYSDAIGPGADEGAPVEELDGPTVEEVTGEKYGGLNWPRRVAAGGEVLAPDRPERRVQFIDVRDLAAWIVAMSAEQRTGTYNATGPDHELQMGRLLEECEASSCSDARLVWVSEDFLEENGVESFTELPLWVPREYGAMLAVNCGRAIAAGLTFRPVSETIRDVLE
jgi:2'-hydroxyisoflavone reductase